MTPRPSSAGTRMSRRAQTALFLVIALGGSYAIGAAWLAYPAHGWLTQFLMWTPGVAALTLHALRREPPRAMGFGVGSARAWAAAFSYPFAVVGACVAIAYAIRAVSGADVIHFQPQAVHYERFGVTASGLAVVPLRLVRQLQAMAPWLLLALAYTYALPERLGAGRHAARAALWCGVFALYPGPWWAPPGCIGEELGWRGWLVRTWRDRPLTALAISACAWASFHLPVIAAEPQLHSFVAAASFLSSIAMAAAVFEALYLWSGSVWPPIIAHFSWNFWNPFFLGNQYGPSHSIFGGSIWLINGEGLLGMLVNGAITLALVVHWRRSPRAAARGPGAEGSSALAP